MGLIRGLDECTSRTGITDSDLACEFKIWKCEHYVYCPFCCWKCDSVKGLEQHLIMSCSDKSMCDGWWKSGARAVHQVLLEIKYYNALKLLKRKDKPSEA